VELFEGQGEVEACGLGPGEAFVRVVVERGIGGDVGREGLTYRGSGLVVGQWVKVPLGRKGVGGVVVACGGAELAEGFDVRRVKRVMEVGEAALTAGLVELGRWISWYYACPLGVVVKAMLPGAVKKGAGVRTRVLVGRVEGADVEGMKLAPSAGRAWEKIEGLEAGLFPMEAKALARLVGASNVGPVNRLVEAGVLELVERREVRGRDRAWMLGGGEAEKVPTPTGAQEAVIEGVGADLGRASVHLLRGVTGSGKTEVYLRLIARAIEEGMGAIVLVPEIALTPQTVRRFAQRFGVERVAVLHSKLTGVERNHAWSACASGEARVLIGPRSAVLAPMDRLGLIVVDEEHESSYKQDSSPRYHGRDVAVKRGFVEGAAVLLGSATPSLESWRNAKEGRYRLWELVDRVSGGALPPVKIVDLAVERRLRAVGSRSPLVQEGEGEGKSWTPSGLEDSATSPGGPGEGRESTDQRTGQWHGGSGSASRSTGLDLVGPTLEGAMRETLGRGSQVILLLNRRGEAGYVGCVSAKCGWTMRCDACDALLSSHRLPAGGGGRYLRCHYCQAAQRVPHRCPACEGKMVLLNAGTQHVEVELERRFGLELGRDLVRVDSDSMRSGRSYFDVLERFGRGEIRVLLGTQMIAKGLDFPNVGLVGVLNADTALVLPDFRAGERTFQLVSQVAGRAGRGAAAEHGRALVLVQTMQPEDPSIVLAAKHDFVRFADLELAGRKAAGLPPTVRMARIVVRDESLEKANELAGRAAGRLRERAGAGVRVEGPEPCTMGRIAGRYRVEVRVLSARAGDMVGALEGLRDVDSVTSDATYAIDVDPVSVL
jgi:primosomal protein N' (replication factor Y) (superfamily II helicase)